MWLEHDFIFIFIYFTMYSLYHDVIYKKSAVAEYVLIAVFWTNKDSSDLFVVVFFLFA